MNKRQMETVALVSILVVLFVVLAGIVVGCGQSEEEALGGPSKRTMPWVIMDKLTVKAGGSEFRSDVDIAGNMLDLDADNDTSITASTDDQIDVEIAGSDELVITASAFTMADMLISQSYGLENVGVPSVVTASVAYDSSGALFTVADGEVWFVHRAVINVTTNFDCTGDDCTLDLGDGNDADGLLNMADADLQAAGTDYTGGQAGWQGLDGAAPTGAYLVGGPQVYAPSGAAETIDITIGGTSPVAGVGVVYLVYTRLQ